MKGRRTSKTLGAGYTENPGGKGRRPATVSPQSYSQKQHTCIQDRRHPPNSSALSSCRPASQITDHLQFRSICPILPVPLIQAAHGLHGWYYPTETGQAELIFIHTDDPPAVCFKADFSHALQLLPSNRREFQVSQCTERAGQAPRVPLSAGSKAHSHTVEPQATPHCSTLHLNRYSPHLTSPSQQLIPVPSPLSPPHVPSRTL